MSGEWKQINLAKMDGTEYLLITKPGARYVGSYRIGRLGEPNRDLMAWRSESGRYATPIAFHPLPEFEAPICRHKNVSTGYDNIRCDDCGAFRTDTKWGVASNQWFESRAHAETYKCGSDK